MTDLYFDLYKNPDSKHKGKINQAHIAKDHLVQKQQLQRVVFCILNGGLLIPSHYARQQIYIPLGYASMGSVSWCSMEETVALPFSHNKLLSYLMKVSYTLTWFSGIFVHHGIAYMNCFPRSI